MYMTTERVLIFGHSKDSYGRNYSRSLHGFPYVTIDIHLLERYSICFGIQFRYFWPGPCLKNFWSLEVKKKHLTILQLTLQRNIS